MKKDVLQYKKLSKKYIKQKNDWKIWLINWSLFWSSLSFRTKKNFLWLQLRQCAASAFNYCNLFLIISEEDETSIVKMSLWTLGDRDDIALCFQNCYKPSTAQTEWFMMSSTSPAVSAEPCFYIHYSKKIMIKISHRRHFSHPWLLMSYWTWTAASLIKVLCLLYNHPSPSLYCPFHSLYFLSFKINLYGCFPDEDELF